MFEAVGSSGVELTILDALHEGGPFATRELQRGLGRVLRIADSDTATFDGNGNAFRTIATPTGDFEVTIGEALTDLVTFHGRNN